MKKIFNILFLLTITAGLFAFAIPVSFAEDLTDGGYGAAPIPDTGASSETASSDNGSNTHQADSGNSHGGHGNTLAAEPNTSATSGGGNEFYNDSKNVGENFCTEPSVKQIVKFFGLMLYILKIIVPVIIIIKGMFLFYNAIIKGGSDDLLKNAKEFGMKVFLGIVVFVIPDLIDGVWDLFDSFDSIEYDYTECEQCLLDPNNCSK